MLSSYRVNERSIKEFKGDTVVIGCGNAIICDCTSNPCHCCRRPHKFDKQFYTIDAETYCSPDLIYNITHPLPANLKKRFKLSILEYIDYTAYSPRFNLFDLESKSNTYHISGFNNVLEMTADDGFIFILGCPRDLQFRAAFKNFKYVEYDDQTHTEGLQHECVLIPKNQALTITEVQQAIRQNPILFDAIFQQHQKDPTENVQFCQIPFCDLPSPHFEMGLGNKIDDALSSLKSAIDLLDSRGKEIQREGDAEGMKAISLAADLNAKLDTFSKLHVKHPATLLQNYKILKTTFVKTLNDYVITHRKQWRPIVANILIALSCVGTLLLAAKLIHSKMTTGKCSIFFAKPKRQLIREKINKDAAVFFAKTERFFRRVKSDRSFDQSNLNHYITDLTRQQLCHPADKQRRGRT